MERGEQLGGGGPPPPREPAGTGERAVNQAHCGAAAPAAAVLLRSSHVWPGWSHWWGGPTSKGKASQTRFRDHKAPQKPAQRMLCTARLASLFQPSSTQAHLASLRSLSHFTRSKRAPLKTLNAPTIEMSAGNHLKARVRASAPGGRFVVRCDPTDESVALSSVQIKKQFNAPRQREGAGFIIRRGVGACIPGCPSSHRNYLPDAHQESSFCICSRESQARCSCRTKTQIR